ncbi:MAG TPA: sugar phosphate isomerase/epimerase family protein [Verrucomicrobiae bacterium]|nr:sugar phosphate isomerase/epimerase family protein [Verrucomicrobiae bacterium]
MNHYLSTHLFVNHRLTTALLGKIQQAGIPAVEIFCARQHLDYYNKAQIAELGHWFRDSQLKLHSLHSPMYNDEIWGRSGPHAVITISEMVKNKRLPMVDEIKRALDIAEVIPFKYLIQHVGVSGEDFSMHKVDACFSALEELSVFARQRGVEILLENIPNDLSTASRLVQFNELTHLKMNFVFDIGHAHICGGVAEQYGIMKSRIRSTHIHDNNGKDDSHLFPVLSGGGSIDWPAAMRLLRSAETQYPLLLELKEQPEFSNGLGSALQIFDKLEQLS